MNPVREKKSEASNKFCVISTYSVVVLGYVDPCPNTVWKKKIDFVQKYERYTGICNCIIIMTMLYSWVYKVRILNYFVIFSILNERRISVLWINFS